MYIKFFLLILLEISSASIIHQEYNGGRVCPGANDGDAKSGNDIEHYNHLKLMYTNCTYVLGNVHIHPMPTLVNKSFDFLSNIVEVSGYVRIVGHLPADLKKLPFTKLTIIRGERLTKYSDASENEFSLFLYNAGSSIENLGFTALKEISEGNVYMGFNGGNCYGENTNWRDIFQRPDEQVARVDILPESNCPPQSERCHPSCHTGLCWGPNANDCQQLNKDICADQCDYRCVENQPNSCCRPGCLAGCDGPLDSDCWGCKNFYNNGTCIHECPRDVIYNRQTYKFEKNPAAKVSFGKLCLPECPNGYLEHMQGCLLHKCPDGFMKDEEGTHCIKCEGLCPRVCDWSYRGDRWITKSFLQNVSNHNCTEIAGNVRFLTGSFLGRQSRDSYLREEPVTLEDMQIFETVEEITGTLEIESEGSASFLTSLAMFRNLKKIGGAGKEYTFTILSSHLVSLDMDNLTEVQSGKIWFETPKLCYPDRDTFRSIFTRSTDITISDWGNPATCESLGLVCHEECSSTCLGPSDYQCVNCENGICRNKCKHFEFEEHCVAECSGNGFYRNGTTCIRCHEQCSGTCTGPLDTHCEACLNYKNGDQCVQKCPNPTYADADRMCQPCNEHCNVEREFGCNGSLSTVGAGGCDSCDRFLINSDSGKVEHCLNMTAGCESNYLTVTQKSFITSLQIPIKISGFKEACIKCDDVCDGCEYKTYMCTSCSSSAYEVVRQTRRITRQNPECIPSCDWKNYYRNDTTRQCLQCHDECNGCTGSTDLDCVACSNFKLPQNDTDSFQCVSECPAHLNHTWFVGKSQICESEPQTTSSTGKAQQSVNAGEIAGPVVAAIVIIVIAAVIITYCCKQKQRHIEKAREYELSLQGPVLIEPLNRTGASPDLSRLKLVKESELKKTIIIGSGAFGTVFKGFLIPDGENVRVPVAIKVLIEGTSPSQTTELLDEARVMASVTHPCCIRIIAVCMAQQLMLITPLMPEGCLLSYVKSRVGRLGSKVLVNWCAQISKGMEHLQSCGIVHRDLAARNVLVQNENQVKITDFGLAKLLDVDEEYYKADSGKVPVKWMALESIQHRIFNHQTDVWSFGVTIWEILTFGQKPYDGVKARDIAILLERGERLNQPTISTIDMYMIMIKCWMLDANTRPTFEDLTREFTKMARDPGRYLVIDGDQLKRNPTLKMNQEWILDDVEIEDEYPDKHLMDADDYLSPSIASTSYPRYENENVNVIPPPFEKSLQGGSPDNLHSPLRYTSSPTLRHFPDDRLTVDTEPVEDYLEPVSVRGKSARPAVDDDGYLQPQSNSVYIDVLADDRTNLPRVKKTGYASSDAHEDEQSFQPLLSADNAIYLNGKSDAGRARPNHDITEAGDLPPMPNGTNPIYMSNNNGSPTFKPSSGPEYKNIDFAV